MLPLNNGYGVGRVEIESAFPAQSNQSLNGRRQDSMVTRCNGEKTRIGLLENKMEELRATRCHHQYQCAVKRLVEVIGCGPEMGDWL